MNTTICIFVSKGMPHANCQEYERDLDGLLLTKILFSLLAALDDGQWTNQSDLIRITSASVGPYT